MIPYNGILLGVNIDHVATIRNARGGAYPDPVQAAIEAEQAGADGITMHLREDRRHITDRDIRSVRTILQTRLNMEMAVTEEMLAIAEEIKPHAVCLVPEKREEITTEGGLDVIENMPSVEGACARLAIIGSEVSLFIDPEIRQVEAAVEAGAPVIELHTGAYAGATTCEKMIVELDRLNQAAIVAQSQGVLVNAGHGLNYQNVQSVAAIEGIHELNIGHAIIGRALFTGLQSAVKEMKALMLEASR